MLSALSSPTPKVISPYEDLGKIYQQSLNTQFQHILADGDVDVKALAAWLTQQLDATQDDAAHRYIDSTDTVRLGEEMTFARVPAGQLLLPKLMHSRAVSSDIARPDRRIIHFSEFEVAQHLVTQAQWVKVMGTAPFSQRYPYYIHASAYGYPGNAMLIRLILQSLFLLRK